LIDDESLIARIVTIKGIGRWAVEMLLMYSLERLDVLPVDDFGVREGYRALKSLSAPLKPKELHEIGKGWAPIAPSRPGIYGAHRASTPGSKTRSWKLPSLKRNPGVKKRAPRNC
jgi:hypothetical protein